jgi:hypothetical protein
MKNQDRRRFFRIDDRLQIALRRAGDAAQGAADAARTADAMVEIDRRLKVLIGSARVQAPAVAELAELLNRKLDHVIDTLQLSEELAQRAAFREYAINLSACGAALHTTEPFEPGERLALEMLFPPGDQRLRVLARTVRCVPGDAGGYMLYLDFAGLAAEDQEFLIQYIVRRQGQFLQQLRERREERDLRPAARER